MNATEDKTYNGWKNYETWCVKLWMDNEEPTCRYWRKIARDCRKAESTSEHWTKEESAKFNLADRLKSEIEEASPLNDSASMYTDLLNAALSEVDWQEIAENLLSDE